MAQAEPWRTGGALLPGPALKCFGLHTAIEGRCLSANAAQGAVGTCHQFSLPRAEPSKKDKRCGQGCVQLSSEAII